MPKKKSKRMARRRFKVTATGKLKRRHAYKGHILTKKTRKRKRKLRQPAMVSHADRRLKKLFQV
jgi:large subunit ribosomal protein L35